LIIRGESESYIAEVNIACSKEKYSIGIVSMLIKGSRQKENFKNIKNKEALVQSNVSREYNMIMIV